MKVNSCRIKNGQFIRPGKARQLPHSSKITAIYKSPPERSYTGKTVCAKGPVEMQGGLPCVVVKDPGQIIVQQ